MTGTRMYQAGLYAASVGFAGMGSAAVGRFMVLSPLHAGLFGVVGALAYRIQETAVQALSQIPSVRTRIEHLSPFQFGLMKGTESIAAAFMAAFVCFQVGAAITFHQFVVLTGITLATLALVDHMMKPVLQQAPEVAFDSVAFWEASSDVQKRVILSEMAFGNKDWARAFGDAVIQGENLEEELSSMPSDLLDTFRKYKHNYPDKNVKDELMLVRMPKTLNGKLTLNNLGPLFKTLFPKNREFNGYDYIWGKIVDELGDKTIDKSKWVVMPRNALPRSENKTYNEQKEMVVDLATETQIPWEVPGTLEAVVCALAEYLRRSKQTPSLFVDPIVGRIWIRCSDKVGGYQLAVSFGPAGPPVHYDNYARDFVRVVALRKF